MAQIDDFIREQFERDNPGERFAFREEHWAQALSLIEAAERKRKRRGLLWWFFGLLLLGGGALWGWHLTKHAGDAKQLPSVAPQETSVENKATETPLATINQENNSLSEIESSKKTTTDSSEENIDNLSIAEKERTNKLTSRETGAAHQNVGSKNKQTEGKGAAHRNALRNNNNKATSNALKYNRLSFNDKSNNNSLKDANVVNKNQSQLSESTSISSAVSIINTKENNLFNTPQNSELTDSILLANFIARRDIETLPITFLPLNREIVGPEIPPMPYNFSQIIPLREKRFTFGITAAVSNYRPTVNQRWGNTAGFYAAYWLRPRWSLAAGLQWRNQPLGSSSDTATTPVITRQLRYRFGYEEEGFSQVNHTLHFMEVPLSIRWHHRVWQLEGGAALGQMIGARATLTQSSRSSLAPVPQYSEKHVWGEKNVYSQQYVAPFVGIGWQPLRFLQLNVRAGYRPTSLLKNSVEYKDNSAAWRFDLGMNWQLFGNHRIHVRQ